MSEITKTATKTALPKEIFAVEVKNHELLKLAYDSYLANSRTASATTLQRGEVRGGGKKPWKQKGTGRARFGSSRNPIWRGGGVVFGPRGNENYTKTITTTSKRVALRQALSLANKAGKIVVLDFKTTGKTAETVKLLADNKLDRKVLLVVDEKTPEILRSTNNVQRLLLTRANYLSVYHILNADKIVITPAALAVVTSWLTKEDK
ncbi:50S ribosomal protein L4 [Candidatus Saccharibacteria bacterium CG11_big_fil_rev_8_21_14_0_20_41_19]|nr:50S ribosomal protein L4 [Candidatus Saccharibacteria bacterium]OIP86241.1 MAG: 50S ribosomal protein L4 [Candidatus Saccharibacteria bacterium CG2_30_41_52]PIQ71054.1 MAG: 50S ribosomal protein L4 [Candidatus Saccharibacteria bacterium CG11_big_fil_rev_8_21_14_0_20_41_19]PIZ59411.1 MAG: 50S ribosomal protein L4 [Candidatus Saccharibacteria bacterium CG_4_10_14_0_2_um_filter_41_11]PJC29473.1 MAG: 50S ribosomal protein L4 [Candidatus Saccharibacteria bacterium CG_4_9_14_0_2_um_filter_41_9]PJ